MNQTPVVKLILVCDSIVYDMRANHWELSDPRTVAVLPPGTTFPFREDELWVYAQLVDGEGEYKLAVMVRQRLNDGSYVRPKVSEPTTVSLEPNQHRLFPKPVVFRFHRIPFAEEGLYEFRVVLVKDDTSVVALDGKPMEITMLDRRTRL